MSNLDSPNFGNGRLQMSILALGPTYKKQPQCRPLASDERRVAGRFTLKNPVTNVFAGHVRVTIEWSQVLQPIRAPTPAAPAAGIAHAAALEGMSPLSAHALAADETIIEVSVLSAAVQVCFFERAVPSWPTLLLFSCEALCDCIAAAMHA
jgi:hypothetical protein